MDVSFFRGRTEAFGSRWRCGQASLSLQTSALSWGARQDFRVLNQWLATGAHHFGFWFASHRNVSFFSVRNERGGFPRVLRFPPPGDWMQPRTVWADRLALRVRFCLESAVGLDGAAIACDNTSGFGVVRRRDSPLFGEVPTCHQSLLQHRRCS